MRVKVVPSVWVIFEDGVFTSLCVCVHMCVHIENMNVCMYTCVCVYVCVCVHVICVCVHVCVGM